MKGKTKSVIILVLIAVLVAGIVFVKRSIDNKKIQDVTVKTQAFLEEQLRLMREAEGYGIHSKVDDNNFTFEIDGIFEDPTARGTYVMEITYLVETEEELSDSDKWDIIHRSEMFFSPGARKSFREATELYVDTLGVDKSGEYMYEHISVVINGEIVKSSAKTKADLHQHMEEFVASGGYKGGGTKCPKCGTSYRYNHGKAEFIREHGVCSKCID